jgi:hypothetical protein
MPPIEKWMLERLREAVLRNTDLIEQAMEVKLERFRGLISNLSLEGKLFNELLLMTDLLAHHIDTEEKLARKILKDDYMKVWMRAVRKRLKRQKEEKRHATTEGP